MTPGADHARPNPPMTDVATLLIGLVSISDRASAGVYEDRGIPGLTDWFTAALTTPWRMETRLIPDEQVLIERTLIELVDSVRCQLVLTTGGTGPAARDVTPEATLAVIDRHVPGIPELMRLESLKITPRAALSRATAGIRQATLIINLPGSVKGVRECLSAVRPILSHAVETLKQSSLGCGE